MFFVDYYTYYSHMKCDEFCTSESTFEEHIPIQKSCSTECLLFLLVWISYASFVSLGNKQMNQDKSHKIYKS